MDKNTPKIPETPEKRVFGMKESTRKICVQSLAGMGASFTIQLLHPFDLIKTRF
jgi:hypothetical protein